MSRHFIVLLALLAVAGGTLALSPSERNSGPSLQFHRLPALLDGWIASDGVAEDVLPTDPRAIQSLRRTYTRNGHTVMLSVARYPSWNHPEHRPLLDIVAPMRGAGEVAFDLVRVEIEGVPGRPKAVAPVNVISLQRRNRPLVVAYWYQLDNEPITNEYGLRLRLFLDTIRNRPRAFVLVRLAAEEPGHLAEFLQALSPRLTDLLAS